MHPPYDILLVEDEPAFRALLSQFLQREGYKVHSVSGVRAALKHLEKSPVKLIITDIFMPEMDGIELLLHLRRSFSPARVIAMSGSPLYDLELFLTVARCLGAHQTLTKPFALQDLLEAVRAAIPDNTCGNS